MVLIALGVVLMLATGIMALRSFLRLRRAQVELQNHLTAEVESLSRRTGELEEGISTLQARAARLPVSISEIQRSLSTLQVLTGALAGSLVQARRLLSYSALESLGKTPLGRLLRAPNGDAKSRP